MVSCEDSFWHRGERQPRNGLLLQNNAESNDETMDNSMYPYEDIGGIQVSGKTAQMQRSVAFVVLDVNFSLVTEQKTGHLTRNKLDQR